MATLSLPIKPFEVPEFVYLDMPAGRKQDGIQGLPKIYLADLDDASLASLIEEFSAAVMAQAGR
jgi:hypothetical protein